MFKDTVCVCVLGDLKRALSPLELDVRASPNCLF